MVKWLDGSRCHRPRPRWHCVRWWPSSSSLSPQNKGHSSQFSAHVYCGQTAGWMKMSLGTEVGRGSRHIVIDGDPAPLYCLLWPNGWMDHSRCHLVPRYSSAQTTLCLTGTQLPQRKNKGHSPHFSAHVYCCQTAGWIKMPVGTEVGLGPGDIVLDGDPAPPKKGHSLPNFRPVSVVAKRLPISDTAEHLFQTTR